MELVIVHSVIEPLTEREQDILALLIQGKSNNQIADTLVLSLNTVKWYNRQIYDKLGSRIGRGWWNGRGNWG
jgi:LuxR family maltose regulon positive regulatory protein